MRLRIRLYEDPDKRADVENGTGYEVDLFGWDHGADEEFEARRDGRDLGTYLLTAVYSTIRTGVFGFGNYCLAYAIRAAR